MYQLIEKEEERLRVLPSRRERDMHRRMLHVPEYLLFTSREASPDRVGVSVEFLDHRGSMPSRHMRASLLKRLVSAVEQGAMRFMSFDEWIMRIVEIVPVDDGHRAVIRVRHVTQDDQLPRPWRSVGPEQLFGLS